MSAISYSYALCRPYVTRRRGSLLHVVRREHFPPGMLPHTERWTLDGTKTGGHIGGTPDTATCPRCRAAFRKILLAIPAPGTAGLVTCPYGCTQPSLLPDGGQKGAACDPEYAGHGEGTHPFATGRFTCVVCRRTFNPAR